jgi:mannosyltransferase OCH1-like enzyme
MPGLRVFVTVALVFIFLQSLTYLAYRNHEPSSKPTSNFRTPEVVEAADEAAVEAVSIRRKLWQTSKYPPMALDKESRENIKRWNEVNPQWRHEVLTDQGSDEYIRDRFAQDTDIVSVYTGLTENIMRADFFRYLVLFGEGGVYSDIDTQILKPIESWIPEKYQNKTNVVVGIEYDTFGLGRGQALLDLQLVNWTILSKANHRLLDITIRNCIKSLKALAKKQNTGIENVRADFNEILASTGPVQLTRSTWQYLTEVTGEEFNWQKVSDLQEPLLVHDVLILPVTSFANGQAHSKSRPPTDKTALVHHQFKGTWKTGSHAYSAMKDSEQNNW